MVSDILFGAVMGIGQSLSAKRDFEREVFKQDREKAARMEELREEYRLSGENALALQKAQQETERLKQEAQTAEEMNQHRSYLSMVFPDATKEEIDTLSLRVRSAGLSTSSLMNAPNAYSLLNSMLEDQRTGTRRATAAPPRTPVNVSPLAEGEGQPSSPDQVNWKAWDAELEASQGAGAAPMPEDAPAPVIPHKTVSVSDKIPNFTSGRGKQNPNTGVTTGVYWTKTGPTQQPLQDALKDENSNAKTLATSWEGIGTYISDTPNDYNGFKQITGHQYIGSVEYRSFLSGAKSEANILLPLIQRWDVQKNSAFAADINAHVLQSAVATSPEEVLNLGAYLYLLKEKSGELSEQQYATVAKLAAGTLDNISGGGLWENASHATLSENSLLRELASNRRYGAGANAQGLPLLKPDTDTVFDRILAAAGREDLASDVTRGYTEYRKGKAAERLSAKAMEQLPDVFYAKESLNETSPDYTKALFSYAKRINLLSLKDLERLNNGEIQGIHPEDAAAVAQEALEAQEVVQTAKELAVQQGLDPDNYAYAARKKNGKFVVFGPDGQRQQALRGTIKKELNKPETKEAPKREPGVNLEPVRDFESQMEAFNRPVQNTGPDDAAGVGILDRIRQDAEQRRESRRSISERLSAFDERLRTSESEWLKKADAAPREFFAFLRETYTTARLERLSRLEAAEQKRTLERLYAEHIQDKVARGEAVEPRRDTLSPQARKVIESVRQRILEAEKAAGKAVEVTLPEPEQAPDMLSERFAEQENLRSLYAQESRRMEQDRGGK